MNIPQFRFPFFAILFLTVHAAVFAQQPSVSFKVKKVWDDKTQKVSNWRLDIVNTSQVSIDISYIIKNQRREDRGKVTTYAKNGSFTDLAPGEKDTDGGSIFTVLGEQPQLQFYASPKGTTPNKNQPKSMGPGQSAGKSNGEDEDAKAAKMRQLERERANEANLKKLRDENAKANAKDPTYAKRKAEADAKLKAFGKKTDEETGTAATKKSIIGNWVMKSGTKGRVEADGTEIQKSGATCKVMLTFNSNGTGSMVCYNKNLLSRDGKRSTFNQIRDIKYTVSGQKLSVIFGPTKISGDAGKWTHDETTASSTYTLDGNFLKTDDGCILRKN